MKKKRKPRFRLLLLGSGVLGVVLAGCLVLQNRESSRRRTEVEQLISDAHDLRKFEKDASRAHLLLKKALKLDPDSPVALFELGCTLLEWMRWNRFQRC